ncbi:hypothetical protein ACE02Y_01130 [Shewanella xiamenensis]|jgi:hypothetical protein|uniref:Uncharacterized protein n=1 Tax=Shewanella xiamenensis TaxID=332186 RepID=A0A073KNZ3_9GAMM|nr:MULTISPECIES: hypothetical protein [Shewanella]PZP35381.1 MAG: hypothetical protein DI594_07110 [Shewanella oneidensis]ASF14263.1 hypothetical protein CEQ32_03935 [Shewanella sp. FDAARGOS_354]KEK28147.1 hypothetical protein SXM_2206 [Shewanella xiamenensis]KPN76655.1 hypothetical protein AEA42_12610 [Shewanella sp. Sh95]MBW0281600.1 hypothetical protein [Shewanella xiamenensis]
MTTDLDLQSAIAALDEYGYEKKVSTDLEQARNKQQMGKYIKSLDYSLRRLLILQETVNELVEEKKHQLAQQENIQTYKTKIINLSREFNISYEDVLAIMAELPNKK